uniref:Thymidylate kinase n=1 Tax=Metchnikovella dogieli TaxID=2804710 RepID=A0A896WN88_9MICR|nr:thymidylate kinase [Metchnikovella dogieli]
MGLAKEDAECIVRGRLIVFEGLDRAGKTTMANKTIEHLCQQGIRMESLCFPFYDTPTGNIIKTHLKERHPMEDHVVHLLFSANRWEAKAKIESALDSGISIVLDRYYPSGIAYSAAKGLPLEWCCGPDNGLPRPDIVFFLSINPENAAARAGYGKDLYEKRNFQEKISLQYKKLKDETWCEIDANAPPGHVFEKIRRGLDVLFQ